MRRLRSSRQRWPRRSVQACRWCSIDPSRQRRRGPVRRRGYRSKQAKDPLDNECYNSRPALYYRHGRRRPAIHVFPLMPTAKSWMAMRRHRARLDSLITQQALTFGDQERRLVRNCRRFATARQVGSRSQSTGPDVRAEGFRDASHTAQRFQVALGFPVAQEE